MKKFMRVITVSLVMCLIMSLVSVASAATIAGEQEPHEECIDMLTVSEEITRGASWPTTAWDLTISDYEGEILGVASGYGVLTNYYFTCSAAGKLRVRATLTASYPLPQTSKCIIQIYDAVTHELVDAYDPGYEAYNQTVIIHTFTGLNTVTPYVVRFYNASSATFENGLSGPIVVEHP